VLIAAAVLDVQETALAFAGPILIVAIGSAPGLLTRVTTSVGDVSYGVYLFGWPVGLLVSAYEPQAGPLGVFALSVPLVFAFAYAMHRLVERPVAEVLKPAVLRHLPRLTLGDPWRAAPRRALAAAAATPLSARVLAYGVCLITVVRFVIYPYPLGLDWFANLWTMLVGVCVVMAGILAAGKALARTTHHLD
jgi:hypothetical protein